MDFELVAVNTLGETAELEKVLNAAPEKLNALVCFCLVCCAVLSR